MPTMIELICTNCAKEFSREKRQLTSSMIHEVKRFFCTRSCNVSWNNKHKTRGDVRSSIEIWLESRIKELHPTLEVIYNGKEAAGSELDIYIPSRKLAFEVNGRAHYEPIWGEEVFRKTLENDVAKAAACKAAGIELIVVDASKFNSIKRDPTFERVVTTVLSKIATP